MIGFLETLNGLMICGISEVAEEVLDSEGDGFGEGVMESGGLGDVPAWGRIEGGGYRARNRFKVGGRACASFT